MIDPYYANVSLLLPMNGADNGTTFTDYSPTPKTITRYGDTKTVTAKSKHYGSSCYFDGTGDYLVPSGGIDTLLATAPNIFTIESWVSPIGAGGTAYLGHPIVSDCKNAASGEQYFAVEANGDLLYARSSGVGSPVSVTSSNTPVTDESWSHVALSLDGVTWRLFCGGDLVASGTTNPFWVNANGAFEIGRAFVPTYSAYAGYFKGHMQDLRITDGVARYVTNFTPPGPLLTRLSGQILDTTGAPCSRTVHLYDNATGNRLSSTTSDPTTGQYEMLANASGSEVFRVVVANEPTLYNHIIDRIMPG